MKEDEERATAKRLLSMVRTHPTQIEWLPATPEGLRVWVAHERENVLEWLEVEWVAVLRAMNASLGVPGKIDAYHK